MEIEELQSAWQQMSRELESQKKISNEIILKMTQDSYRNKFTKLANYESVGAVVCYGIALSVILNFQKLDTWYLMLCGVATIGFLTILPTLVLKTIRKIKNVDILKGTYKENLVRYTTAKNNLLKLQQIGIVLSFIMMFLIVPVTSKILSNKNIFLMEMKPMQWFSILIALVFMVFVSLWGYKSYLKITNSAAKVLRELE